MHFSITISSWKYDFTNNFSLYMLLDLVSHFFLMCYLSSEADRNWPHHPGYFFSEPSLSFGPWKVWPRGERQGEEKNEIFCPGSSHDQIPNICQDCILWQLQHFTGDLSCVAPALSLGSIKSFISLLLQSLEWYYLLACYCYSPGSSIGSLTLTPM